MRGRRHGHQRAGQGHCQKTVSKRSVKGLYCRTYRKGVRIEGKPSNISYKLGSIHWSEHTGMDTTQGYKYTLIHTVKSCNFVRVFA